jgi:RNA polymerase sigma-70 factor, ECF subfamily
VNAPPQNHAQQPDEAASATLGDVLYPDKSKARVPEQDWVLLVQRIAAGNQPALHALYERAHRVVFTLIVRIVANRETAEELTLDVFHDVWRRASGYDAANGTVLGWIMNQARSRALDRLRFDKRKKRVDPHPGEPVPMIEESSSHELLEFKEQWQALASALATLPVGERQAIEAAFLSELTHAEAAARLNQPLGTVKTRIRSALHKLRQELTGGGEKS